LYPTTEKKSLPLYPTIEENLFCCIPQWEKTSSVVSHNGGKYLPLLDTVHDGARFKNKLMGVMVYF
jgi:hypothetical protein